MRRFARRYVGGTDTSRDYECTDRDRLRRDAESFLVLRRGTDATTAAEEEPLAIGAA